MQQVTSIANQAVFDLPGSLPDRKGSLLKRVSKSSFSPRPHGMHTARQRLIPSTSRRSGNTRASKRRRPWPSTPASGARYGAPRPVPLGDGLSCCGRPLCRRPSSSGPTPRSPTQALRHRPIAVNFHAGSHYLTLQLLEGFMEREAITVVHVGQAPGRYRALWEGRVDAVTVMEPYIALAEKQGCHVLAEAFYVGAEILSPALDTETATGVSRAITRAVERINADKRQYLHHLIAELRRSLGRSHPQTFICPGCVIRTRGHTPKTSLRVRTTGWSVGT